jgi:hypothetical protein
LGGRAGVLVRSTAAQRIAALVLVVILASSLLLVVMAADRPSGLAPTTHSNYFPHWMAGPLGGLWPGLTWNGNKLRYLFTGALALMYVAYVVGIAYLPRLRARWVIAAILGVHAIYLLAPPLALTDVFNYINYGRMEVVHHLNPYTTIPILEPHDDPSYVLSNWHQLLSPYGPLFTMLTFALVPLGVAASFWAIKCILALASLATIFLVWKCAQLLGRNPITAIVLVGLNPIVLVWGLGGDHNDFLMVLFIVLAFYLMLRARAGLAAPSDEGTSSEEGARSESEPRSESDARSESDVRSAAEARSGGRAYGWRLRGPLWPAEIGAGAALLTAAAVKASGAVLIPVVVVGLLRSPRRLTQVVLGMVGAGVIVGVISLIAFGLHIPDLSTQSRLVTSESIPNLVGLALGKGGETLSLHTDWSVILGVALLCCCLQAFRRRASITACGWASVALLVTLSWVLPWYVLWVLPLAALSESRRLRAATLVVGVYLIVAWAPASGLLWSAIGFHPERTSLGRLHQRYVKEILN